MRIGLVCPYSFDVPGGVQFHVRDLAEHLIAGGHEVSVLAPADEEDLLPDYFTSCGRAVPVRYNGSVARLTFGPVSSARVGRWLDRGDFDLVHLHEPVTPSASVMALWQARVPVVATFHTATPRSRAMHTFQPVLRPSLEKIRARIAVSEDARLTVRRHLRGDAYVIPNGVHVDRFAQAPDDPRFVGTASAPTIAVLGRIDEPRKGLSVLLEALPAVISRHPGIRVLVAGPGDLEDVAEHLPGELADRVELLGLVSEADKAALLHSVDLYIAPHTGGESFGIVLVEAMAAGAPVIASDLSAFVRVLGSAKAGVTFPVHDSAALAQRILELLADPAARHRLAAKGQKRETLWGRLVRSGRGGEDE
jgi:phosphatidylinositol alpha-mannosyltransferase